MEIQPEIQPETLALIQYEDGPILPEIPTPRVYDEEGQAVDDGIIDAEWGVLSDIMPDPAIELETPVANKIDDAIARAARQPDRFAEAKFDGIEDPVNNADRITAELIRLRIDLIKFRVYFTCR